MPRLVILEGADGVGKSSQAALLSTKLGAKFIHQPSGEGVLGFIRDEVKLNPAHNMFERQLLHTASHLVDAYKEFNGADIVMDRSPLSGLVYGKASGALTQSQLELLSDINIGVYREVVQQRGYQVDIICMDMVEGYKDTGGDIYENTIQSATIRSRYFDLFSATKVFFSPEERVHFLYLHKSWSITTVSKMIAEVLGV